MGMQDPAVGEPIDKLSEHYPDGTPFFLLNVRIVEAKSTDFGTGEMVIVKVRDHERELGVWGAYLLAQAKSVDPSDLNQWYAINRRVIAGFGKGRAVKVFDRVPAPDQPATARITDAA